MTDPTPNRTVVKLDTINAKTRRGGKRGKKIAPFVSPLSWTKSTDASSLILDRRGYSITKESYEELVDEVIAAREANLEKQNAMIDKDLELMGIRKRNIVQMRNAKEVRIRL